MNIFENMCEKIKNLPTKVNAGTESEYEISPHGKYITECSVVKFAIREYDFALEKVHRTIFRLGQEEADLQEQAMHINNKFFRLPLIREVVIMHRKRSPELRKVQAEMSECFKEEEDLRNQYRQILDYRDLLTQPSYKQTG